jgi:hypothetical protein
LVTPITKGWADFELLHINKVRDVIASFEPHLVGIFSFAIHDTHQLGLFDTYCRPHLEKALGVKFGVVLTVDLHIIPTCARQMGLHPSTIDFQEMINFWGKQGAFRLVMQHRAAQLAEQDPHRRQHHLLLDDVVTDELLTWPALKTTVEQRNIYAL